MKSRTKENILLHVLGFAMAGYLLCIAYSIGAGVDSIRDRAAAQEAAIERLSR